MQVLQIFLAICIFLETSDSQVFYWKSGTYRKMEPMRHFDPMKHFRGTWYECKILGYSLVPKDATCVTFKPTYLDEDTVEALFYWYNSSTHHYEKLVGLIDAKTKFFEEGIGIGDCVIYSEGNQKVHVPFLILYTNYDKYAVVYSWHSEKGLISDTFWILVRTRSPSAVYDDEIKNILSKAGVDYTEFISRMKTNCPANEPTL